MRRTVRDQLIAAAQSSGVSISEEVERRIEQSFSNAGVVGAMFGGDENARLLFMFAIAIQEVERLTGKRWREDPATSEQMRRAIDSVILAQMPISPEAQKRYEEFVAKHGTLAELGARYGRPFIDHFAIGHEAAAFALFEAQGAVRNLNADAPPEPANPPSEGAKTK
jgi:hypothetical protein